MPLRDMDRDQMWLLPPSLDELLPLDHPARFVAEFVDALDRDDWAELGVEIEGDPLGAPSYHPRALLSVWLYGFMTGVHSCRKLETACRDQIPYLWHLDIGIAADTDAHIHIHYAENGMGEVRDFYSKDPEGSRIEWNVRGVDAADFDIDRSTGVLTFRDSPDYENPTDRGLNLDAVNEGDFTDDGDFAPGDNNYQITVSATEMRAGANAPLPAMRTDIALTVIVGNEDDDGELTLQWLQPEVGTPITATLTDPDTETEQGGTITSPDWTWYTSKAADPVVGDLLHWTEITDETDNSYTPVPADEGDYLWVHVEYTDPHDGSKEADAKSENPVRAEVSANANASPDFPDDTDTRTVPESTAVGDPVGDPVVATDTDNDTLTYELDNDALPTNTLAAASDLQFFDIDRETGQIEVAKELDFDAVGGGRATGAVAGTYMVIVRATDPSGLADNITITITAENVNEDPIVTGRAELSVVEGTIDITDPDAVLAYTSLPDAPGGQSPDPTNQQNEYVYEDPDHLDSIARWTLEGDDAGAFDQSGRFEPRYIQFKVAPDYENPTDEPVPKTMLRPAWVNDAHHTG